MAHQGAPASPSRNRHCEGNPFTSVPRILSSPQSVLPPRPTLSHSGWRSSPPPGRSAARRHCALPRRNIIVIVEAFHRPPQHPPPPELPAERPSPLRAAHCEPCSCVRRPVSVLLGITSCACAAPPVLRRPPYTLRLPLPPPRARRCLLSLLLLLLLPCVPAKDGAAQSSSSSSLACPP